MAAKARSAGTGARALRYVRTTFRSFTHRMARSDQVEPTVRGALPAGNQRARHTSCHVLVICVLAHGSVCDSALKRLAVILTTASRSRCRRHFYDSPLRSGLRLVVILAAT